MVWVRRNWDSLRTTRGDAKLRPPRRGNLFRAMSLTIARRRTDNECDPLRRTISEMTKRSQSQSRSRPRGGYELRPQSMRRGRGGHPGQAALLGTASDATLAALPQLHREQTGKGFLLASKLDAEAAAFVGTLLNCVGSSAAIGMQSDPLSVAETAAELRQCSSADALKAISALPETVLGAVSRAFGAQGSNGLISHLHKLLGSSGQLRALLQARIERAAALPEAAGKGGGGHSHPSAARAARRLHAAGKGLFCGTDEDTFIEVLGFASPSFAAAIRYEYAMRFGHTLASAVRDEMRGDLQALLLAFLQKTHDDDANAAAATTLAESRARALWAASEGAGYDGAAWARIFGEVTCSQLAELMRIMQRHGLPLPALIRDEFYGDAKELLLVRCRWAASEARRRTAAAKALPLTLPTPPPGRITIGENFPFKAVDSAALGAWAALIATTAASSMGRLLSAYSTVDGSAAVDLSADLHALVTSDDEQYVAVRDLLFALLCRPPIPFAARESSRSLPLPVSSATTSLRKRRAAEPQSRLQKARMQKADQSRLVIA